MSHATDFLETAVGNALFLNQPLVITQWTVHLFTVAPHEDGTNGLEIPIDGYGYQPVRHDPGGERWEQVAGQDANNNTLLRNKTPVQFPTVITIWTINAVGLKNQDGVLCFSIPLASTKIANPGEAPVFLAGELEFAIG